MCSSFTKDVANRYKFVLFECLMQIIYINNEKKRPSTLLHTGWRLKNQIYYPKIPKCDLEYSVLPQSCCAAFETLTVTDWVHYCRCSKNFFKESKTLGTLEWGDNNLVWSGHLPLAKVQESKSFLLSIQKRNQNLLDSKKRYYIRWIRIELVAKDRLNM